MPNHTLAITNLAKIVTGDIDRPVAEGDTIIVRDAKIEAVGSRKELKPESAEVLVDAGGMTAMPGLIDPHIHPMLGDWSPRHSVMGLLEGALHGGVTSMLSQGIVHMEGRPRDAYSTKALAILTTKLYQQYRPGGGLKLLSGAVILERGLTEADFAEVAREGVRLVAEVGASGIYNYDEIQPMLEWARKSKLKIPLHFGGPSSLPGSARFWADEVLQYRPDVVAHINGGPIAAPLAEIDRVLDETATPVEVIHTGNLKAAVHVVGRLKEENNLRRLIIGSDTPVGHGVIPLAIMKTLVHLCPLLEIEAPVGIALATGNTARVYELDGVGFLKPGCTADMLVVDAPKESAGKDALGAIECGDVPAINLIVCDGKIVARRGKNTPHSYRAVKIREQSSKASEH
jgi:enamidase